MNICYDDFLNHNPHLHAIVSDGCFLKDGSFQAASVFMLEDLARNIIRACFERQSFTSYPRKVFNALDWLARLVTHIPGRNEH